MQKITGIDIQKHDKSNRIIKISLENDIIDKLIFPFNKFDLTALELKPFTRFTLAKSLDDLTNNKLSELMNSIIRDRSTGCFIIGPKIKQPVDLSLIIEFINLLSLFSVKSSKLLAIVNLVNGFSSNAVKSNLLKGEISFSIISSFNLIFKILFDFSYSCTSMPEILSIRNNNLNG